MFSFHTRPAILLEYARNIRLTDISIHAHPGIGVIGNRCENVTITGLSVVPSEGYHISVNTDATHFTSIKGFHRLENCTCIGQGDDFINVHTYYHRIARREGDAAYLPQESTPDGTITQSLDYPDPEDIMELVSKDTL